MSHENQSILINKNERSSLSSNLQESISFQDLQMAAENINRKNPFHQLLGIRILKLESGQAWAKLDNSCGLVNMHQSIHGGALYSLADAAAGAAAFSSGFSCVTQNGSLNFLKPAKNGAVYAQAVCLHAGWTSGVYEVSLKDEDGTLLARGDFTMHFLHEKKPEQ